MQFTGIIQFASPAQQVGKGDKVWTKQEFLIEEASESEHKQSLAVVCFNKPALAAWMADHIGQFITADLDTRAKKGAKGLFNDITVWRISQNGQYVDVSNYTSSAPAAGVVYSKDVPPTSEDEDLPF